MIGVEFILCVNYYKSSLWIEEFETQYWLEVVRDADLLKGIELDRFITEANELTAIFTATNKTAKSNNEK
ncbi:MAG: hypothetical protein H0U39_03790 [Segetibacter sp.]|nr:hypothetical protein [Segetibacter sp.]